MNTTAISGGADHMAPSRATSVPDTQAFNTFTHAVYFQLSGVQKELGRILGSLDHLHGNVQPLERRIDSVETRVSDRIVLVETTLRSRIGGLDLDVKVHKRLILVASGGLGMVVVLIASARTVADMFLKLDALRTVG
jgi:hypothetical protein